MTQLHLGPGKLYDWHRSTLGQKTNTILISMRTRKICTIGLAVTVYGRRRRDFIHWQLGSDASRVTASIEPLASLIRLSIISSLQRRKVYSRLTQ